MARSPNPADQPCVSHSLVQIRQSWQQRIMYPSQSIFSIIFSITLSNCAGSSVCSTWEETSSKVLSRSFSTLPQITVKTGEKHSTSEWNCFLISWNFSTFSAQGETCKLVWSNVHKRLAGTSDPGRSKLKTQHNWKQGDHTPEVALVAGVVTALRLTFFHAKLQDPKSYVPWIDCHHPYTIDYRQKRRRQSKGLNWTLNSQILRIDLRLTFKRRSRHQTTHLLPQHLLEISPHS